MQIYNIYKYVNNRRTIIIIIIIIIIAMVIIIKKELEKYKQQIPGNIKIHELQKITLHETSHILRNVLSIK